MSLFGAIAALLGRGTMGSHRTQAEIDLETSQLERFRVEAQQERNRRNLAQLKLLDLEVKVITRRSRVVHPH